MDIIRNELIRNGLMRAHLTQKLKITLNSLGKPDVNVFIKPSSGGSVTKAFEETEMMMKDFKELRASGKSELWRDGELIMTTVEI